MNFDRHMARVYLAQARVTPFPGWRTTLLAWAKRRRVVGRARVPRQFGLFPESI